MDSFNMNTQTWESFSSLPANKLYYSSRFNNINWNVFTPHDVQSSIDSFQNLNRFNYINWNLFKIEPHAECHEKSPNAFMKTQHMDPILWGYSGQPNFGKFDDLFKYKLWNYETNTPVEPLFEDEGFSTPGSNFSEELCERHDRADSEMLTSVVNLEIAAQVRFIWEQQGHQWTHKEPKFVSELYESISSLWKIWNVTRLMCHPTYIGLQISFEEFKTDINHLMFGVASNSFYFAPVTKTFHVREKLHLPAVTPEAIASFCTKFLECGNNFVALRNFTMTKSKIRECGPIHRTFCSCVKNVMQMHRFSLLSIKWENIHTLSELEILSFSFRRKISFTKDLCTMYFDDDNHENKLPHGVLLLDRLYASLVHIETTDLKFLALYFFESCCSIYLKIVSEWLFDGCFSNPANYDEFFVQIQHELEVCWDWRRLSYIRVNERQIPQCFKKFFKDIFACGKSVNLLRIFSRKEVFEQILPKMYPSIRCCFNSAQIEAYTLEWRQFQDNFQRKRNWSIKLKDRLIQNYNPDFQNIVKETRRKWFEDFETRQRGTIENPTNTNETSKNSDKEPPMISSLGRNQKIEIAELDSCTATDFSIIERGNDPNERAALHTVTEFGDGLPDKILTSECPESESTSMPAVIVSSSAYRGAGDCGTPLRCISPISQTEYQRNRQNSMSSTTFSQSSTTSFPEVEKEFTSTPLSACAQNRLKNMSTTFNNDPIESVNDMVTPVSECVRNRMKVMRSEYHERLSYAGSAPLGRTAGEMPFSESECSKNRLKVMTSEYHIRLNALSKQEIGISRKLLNDKNTENLIKREINEEKVLFEEMDQHARANTEENSIAGTVDSAANSENTITNIVSDEVNLGNDSEDKESGSVSENLVTMIENAKNTDLINEGVPIDQSMINRSPFNPSQHSKYPNIFSKLVTQSTSTVLVSARSVKDVDITSVLYYLSPSISIPLRIQSKLANEAILWVFIEQEGYLEHLKTLKNYILLRKAEFSLSITNSLFEMCEDVKSPSLLLNSYTLNSILQRALSACNSEKLTKFQRNLSFTLEDPIPDSFNQTDIQMLRCLSMHYMVKWPVNVLITEPIVKKYTRIFRFLIQLQRVSWVLKTDFKYMKNFKQGKSVQFTQIQLFRHTMTQIIRLLKEYVMREALEQCWSDLVHNLTNIEINLDELYMMHLKYINKIIQRCFLCEDSIVCHKAVLHIFGSVLQYHNALRKGSWHRNEEFNLLYHTNFKNLHAAYQEFGKNLDSFRTVLRTLVNQKQKTYFEPLLLQLNNNTKNETEL